MFASVAGERGASILTYGAASHGRAYAVSRTIAPGKTQPEAGADMRSAFASAMPRVNVHDRLHDGEAKSRTRRRGLPRGIDTIKPLEYALEMVSLDAGPRIRYGQRG